MGAISTVQTRHLLREFLLRSSSITDLVGQNVYGSHLSDSDAGTVLNASPLIILEFDGGNMRWYGAVQTQFVEVYTYSKNNLIEAASIYDALANVLQHERLIISGIDMAAVPRETERPTDGYNKHLDAWYVKGRWLVEAV